MLPLPNSALPAYMTAKEIAACPELTQFNRAEPHELSVRTIKTYIKHGILVPYDLIRGPRKCDYFHVASVAVRYKVWREWALQRRTRRGSMLTVPEAGKLLNDLFGSEFGDPDGKPAIEGESLRQWIMDTFANLDVIPVETLKIFVDDIIVKLRKAGRI